MFVSKESCDAAVASIASLIGKVKPGELSVAVHAQCVPVKPDREA